MSRENRSKYAILGFLDLMPMSGYDIRKFAALSLSHFWNEDYGHIYPALRLLEAEGLAAKKREAGQGKPDRNVYSITNAGREALRAWISADPQRPHFRMELLLKVFFASRMPEDRLRQMLEAEIASCDRNLAELRETAAHLEKEIAAGGERAREARCQRMALRFGLNYYDAVRIWCEESMEEL